MQRLLFLWLLAGSLHAQLPNNLATDPHPNAPYRILSYAYGAGGCDSVLAAQAYAPDAHYLTRRGEHGVVHVGHAAISQAFGFLGRMRARGCGLTLRFTLQQRSVGDKVMHDVGYYHLSGPDGKGGQWHGYGQFFTVLTKQADGTWRFQFDTDTPATATDFAQGKVLE